MKFGTFPAFWYQAWPIAFVIWVLAWFIGQIIELAIWARGAMKESDFFKPLPMPPDDDEKEE